MAILSIMGMYSYKNAHGGDLFSKLVLPDGIDKDALTDNILLRSAEFEALYADADFMENCIGLWAKKHYRTFEKWINALSVDYNPLENYDRIEEWNETNKNNGTTTDVSSGSGTINGTNTRSAYNSDKLEPHDAQSSSSVNNSNSTTSVEATNENVRTGHTHGNIGVTTSQQMLQSELDIARFNLIEQITDLFVSEFCILVY